MFEIPSEIVQTLSDDVSLLADIVYIFMYQFSTLYFTYKDYLF